MLPASSVPRRPLGSPRLALLAVGLSAVAAIAAACTGTTLDDIEPTRGVTEVELQGNRFAPRVIEVPAGTEVTWIWEGGSVPHDVRGDGFDSGLLNEGTFSHTFATPGTYDYECTLHANMTGRVVVID